MLSFFVNDWSHGTYLCCRCGSVINMRSYHERLEEGVEPTKAWDNSKDDIDENARYGTWKGDYFLSKPDNSGHFCHALEIRLVLHADCGHTL